MNSRPLAILLLFVLAASLVAPAQVTTIALTAGTPEDQASSEITKEADPQKRLALIQDALSKFSSNPMAAAYFQWQLAQHYQTAGDVKQAIAAGEKALEAQPNNVEIMMTVAATAQTANDWATVCRWSNRGGMLINGIGKGAPPAGLSPEEYAARSEQQKATLAQMLEFFEAASYNGIANEQDPKRRMAAIEQFTPAFPKSKFAETVAQFAILSLQQLNDSARLATFGAQALAANPDSIATLTLLATAFAEEQSGANLAKAVSMGRRAVELAKPKAADADAKRKLQAGLAYSATGYALMRQKNTVAAINDFREAAGLLKSAEPAAYQTALYRLGYAYATLSPPRLAEAKAALSEAAALDGPFRQAAREVLAKVNARAR